MRRRLLAIAGSFALGSVCGFLPPQYQLPCKGAAKLVALVLGLN